MIVRADNITRLKTAAITEAISGTPWPDEDVVKSEGDEGDTFMRGDDADIDVDGELS